MFFPRLPSLFAYFGFFQRWTVAGQKKSLFVAYLLLFVGGWAGLHLLYLRRDKQAFIYWCTFGGYFGLGPIRDFFRLHVYVKDVNDDPEYLSSLAELMHKRRKPPFSVSRFTAQILIGNSWCYLWVATVPEEDILGFSLKFLKYLGPVAAALGVWLIGNIGREKGSLYIAMKGAFLIAPFAIFHLPSINWSCVTAAIMFQWRAKEWRRTPMKHYSLCRRFYYLMCGWLVFCSVWIIFIYFNAEVTYKDGETAKLKDAIPNFFKSPMFLEFKKNMWKLYEDAKEHGWSKAWTNLMELIDPLGEYHALKILNLPKNATQEDITVQFKKLSREWHPDRHHDSAKKKEAHDKFVEISDAYEKLSIIKKRRKKRNKISNKDGEDHSDAIAL